MTTRDPNRHRKHLRGAREFPTLREVRREAARLYWMVKQGEIDPQLSSRLAYILQVIASVLRSEGEADVEKIRAEVAILRAEVEAARGGSFGAVDRAPVLRLPTARKDGSIG